MKICTNCELEKCESEFHKNSKTSDRLRHWCKICANEDNKSREHKYKEYRKKYREDNSAKISKTRKIYYRENKDHILYVNTNYRSSPHYRFVSYKNNAKYRNIDWCLSKEEFLGFWNKPCYYCGSEIITIGIDRKDSAIGYVIGNLVPCCSLCNTIKLDLTIEEFLKQIEKIYKFNNGKI